MLDGDPGLAKSTMLLDIAARVSKESVMPDGSLGLMGNVLVISAEDAAADTIPG
jgi:predicted ATP-dependent serine protease